MKEIFNSQELSMIAGGNLDDGKPSTNCSCFMKKDCGGFIADTKANVESAEACNAHCYALSLKDKFQSIIFYKYFTDAKNQTCAAVFKPVKNQRSEL